MSNYGKLTEKLKIDTEVITVSSAAGATSQNYDMSGYQQAAILVNVEGTFDNQITLDLMESSAATAAGSSAAGSKAGIAIGASANTYVDYGAGVRALTITMASVATGATGDVFTLSLGTVSKTFTFSTSTANANATAWTTSKLYFGTTVGATADTGIKTALEGLVAAVNSTKGFGNALVCTTPTTATLKLVVRDEAPGTIGFISTGSTLFLIAQVNQAAGAFNIKNDQMTSTASKTNLSIKISTASSSCHCGITVIRSGGRYQPDPAAKYKVSS
jgi:hypothetical protein